jgi:hypothetical protein
MSVELPAKLISPTGIAQRNSQVNWTMTMSSRGWQAPHGLAGQPRHAEHRHPPRAGGARTRQLRLQVIFTGRNMLLTCGNVEGLGDKKP